MKYFFILTTIAFILTGNVVAQFEGVMDMKVTGAGEGKDESMMYTMAIKKNLMSTEIKNRDATEEAGKFIFRGDRQVIWILNDQEKSYLEISLKDDGKSEKNKKERKDREHPAKVKKTGNKVTILGYVCEEVVIEGEEEVTHIWGTPKLGDLYGTMMKSFAEMAGPEEESPGWDDEIAKLGMFPLKVISKEDDKIIMTQEVTKIEQKKIPESAFDVPKDYKKQSFDFDIQKMMEQLQKDGKKHKEEDKDDPGGNVDMEKMMQQLKDMQKDGADTTDGGY